mgnify:CR=1 FL=1
MAIRKRIYDLISTPDVVNTSLAIRDRIVRWIRRVKKLRTVLVMYVGAKSSMEKVDDEVVEKFYTYLRVGNIDLNPVERESRTPIDEIIDETSKQVSEVIGETRCNILRRFSVSLSYDVRWKISEVEGELDIWPVEFVLTGKMSTMLTNYFELTIDLHYPNMVTIIIRNVKKNIYYKSRNFGQMTLLPTLCSVRFKPSPPRPIIYMIHNMCHLLLLCPLALAGVHALHTLTLMLDNVSEILNRSTDDVIKYISLGNLYP